MEVTGDIQEWSPDLGDGPRSTGFSVGDGDNYGVRFCGRFVDRLILDLVYGPRDFVADLVDSAR
jgi:hypothetical protein